MRKYHQLPEVYRLLIALFVYVLFVLLSVRVARAEDIIFPLAKGDAAPFAGQLFDPKTALRWGTLLKNLPAKAKLERERDGQICKANLDAKDEALRIEQEKADLLVNDLKMRILKTDSARVKLQYELDHPPWYTSFWFGIGVGVVTTTTLVIVGSQVF